MARGRDTSTLRVDKRTVREILENCDNPIALKAIFDLARDMVFGRATLQEFHDLCQATPCILWQPGDPKMRHVTVPITRETDRVMIRVTRVVWRIITVLPAQGLPLRGDEELLHICANKGGTNSAYNMCLNPGHLIRGNAENRMNLVLARNLMKKVGVRSVA